MNHVKSTAEMKEHSPHSAICSDDSGLAKAGRSWLQLQYYDDQQITVDLERCVWILRWAKNSVLNMFLMRDVWVVDL